MTTEQKAPAPMTAARMQEIIQWAANNHPVARPDPVAEAEWRRVDDLLLFLHTQETQIAALREQLATQQQAHKTEVLDILRDMRLPLLAFDSARRETDEAVKLGQNIERAAINKYCREKAYEYDVRGIGPDPVKDGEWDTLAAAGAVQEGSPAGSRARCPGCGLTTWCATCPENGKME